jgi:phosphocarrier protein HPr
MLDFEVKIVNHLGLHARAAAQLVKLSTQFQSSIKIKKINNENEANAKSILGILSLAASYGTVVRFKIEGSDEAAAKVKIEDLFLSGFGEL